MADIKGASNMFGEVGLEWEKAVHATLTALVNRICDTVSSLAKSLACGGQKT